MKKITFIIILFFVLKTHSQIKIFINKNENKHYQNIYSLKKSSDNKYIFFTNSEDMGKIYGCKYELKENIPDNKYKIYVNDTLTSVHILKKQTIKILEYYKNGKLRAIQTDDGHSNKTYKSYYENGRLRRYSPTKYFYTDYYENGNVSNRLFSGSNKIFIEDYESNGKIRNTSFRYHKFLKDEDNFQRNYNLKNLRLNGKATIVLDKLIFNLEYNMNKLLYIQIKENGNIVFEKRYHQNK